MTLRILFTSAVVTLAAAAVQGGDLKIQFQYADDAPAPQPINVVPGVCGGLNLTEQRLLVNPENRGIKNVVVYVYVGRGGSKLPPQQQKKLTRELANNNCQFEPHILTAQVGDTLKITNRDPAGHNTHLHFLRNGAQNFVIPAGGASATQLQQDEPAPIPVDCNIHLWMRAYVVVLDHPFVGVSDEDGRLMIEDLPEGDELIFRVFHEAATGSLEQVIVNGTLELWNRNRFSLKIGSGVNDYGTVILSADQLSLNGSSRR